MPKPKTPRTHGERFDRLLQNLAAAVGNDDELAALHEVAESLWQLLTPEQEGEFFDAVLPLETKAARWAGADDSRPSRSPAVSRPEALARACECLLAALLESGDLNDLPVSEVIKMLQDALRRSPRAVVPDRDNIATHVARIVFSLDRGFDLCPAALEEIIAAATALDSIESEPGFTWETQPSDWENICARIADILASRQVRSWVPVIRRLLHSPRRGVKRRAP